MYDYARQYIQVLMSNANIPALTLSLVDGFAGGGHYSSPEGIASGSPLLLLEAVNEAVSALNVGRQNPRSVNAHHYFVEKKRSNFDYLKSVLRAEGYGDQIGQTIGLYNSKFVHASGDIVSRIKKRKGGERAIFLLDQYAYKDVPLPQVKEIFNQLQGAEVILTFNVDSLITFLGNSAALRTAMRKIGLEEYINWQGYEALKEQSQWRQIIQEQLSHGIWKASGAKFMTLFFVTPLGDTPWSYWLVHLSNKFRARDVMMTLHWDHGNSFAHSLEPGLFQIGYEANGDEAATGQRGFELGAAHAFDSLLHSRCIATLSEELPKLIYANENGIVFGDLVQHIANRTTATAELAREALDVTVKTGDILVRGKDGSIRVKGASIRSTDIILPSPQRPIFF